LSAWIAFTVLAAFMQAVRTAGQKQLTSSVSPMGATLIRYVYGLPFAVIYLLFITQGDGVSHLLDAIVNRRFVVYAILAGVAQILATFLLIKVFSFRNFTVGTSFAKTEAIQTAVFASVFFGATLNALGWLAVAIGVAGINKGRPLGTGQCSVRNNVRHGVFVHIIMATRSKPKPAPTSFRKRRYHACIYGVRPITDMH